MAESVLESFLIKLSYRVDEASAKRFTTAITDGFKEITKFTTAILGMAVAVEEAVRRTSAQLARLSFAATMGGTTVTKLREYGNAIEAVGGSFGDLVGAQEALNQRLTEAPWMKSYFRSQLRGFTADYAGIIEKYHQLRSGPGGEYRAAIFSKIMREQFGIDMRMAEMADRHRKEYVETLAHNKKVAAEYADQMKQAEANSVKLWVSQTKLSFTIGTVWQSLTGGLSGILAGVFDKFDKWLQGSAPYIKEFLNYINPLIQQLTDEVLEWIDDLIKHPEKIREAWENVKGYIVAAWEDIKKIYLTMKDFVCDLYDAFKWLSDIVGGPTNAALAIFFGWMLKGAAIDLVTAAIKALAAEMWAASGAGDALTGALGKLWPVLAVIGGLEILKHTGLVGGKDWQVWDPAWGPPPADWKHPVAGQEPENKEDRDIFDKLHDWFFGGSKDKTSGQHGGIVPIDAHAGEMVLPTPISAGLQALYAGGGQTPLDNLGSWLTGDRSFEPAITLLDDVYERLTDAVEEALRRIWPDGTVPTTGGGGGGGGNGGGGNGGGGDGDGGGGPVGPGGAGALTDKAAELISKAEGTFRKGAVDYDIGYGGEHVDLSHMSLNEVLKYQAGLLRRTGHSPVGAFQIIAPTIAGVARKLHLDMEKTMFTPEVQKQFAGYLLSTSGIGQWSNTHPELMRQVAQMGGGAFETGGGGDGGPASGEKMSDAVGKALSMVGQTINDPSLRNFVKLGAHLDPRAAAWCAAYVNSVLKFSNVKGSGSNLASSFMHWGHGVDLEHMMKGDIGVAWHGVTGSHAVFMTGRKAMEHGRMMVETVGREHGRVATRWRPAEGMHFRRGDAAGEQVNVDNSTNVTHIHGVQDPHGVHRVVADMGDRRSTYHKRNRRTFVG